MTEERELCLEQACRAARAELIRAEAAYDAALDGLRAAERDLTKANRALRDYRRGNES
jgi:hypothetical protein